MREDHTHLIKTLKEGEEVERIIRRYWLTYFWQIFFATVFMLVPFFFLYPLFRYGGWGIALFVALLVIGGIIVGRVSFVWTRNVFIVTNMRIIDINQRGFFAKSVSEASLAKVQDVTASTKGVFPTLFRYGTVRIQTAGTENKIELDHVFDPESIKDFITDWQHRFAEGLAIREGEGEGEEPDDAKEKTEDNKELRDLVRQLKEKVGEEELRKMLE